MSNKIDFIIGIEFELEYNRKHMWLKAGNYHGKTTKGFGKRFIVETDGSLRAGTFVLGHPVEIISKPLLLKHYKRFLKSFQRMTYTNIQKTKKLYIGSYKERAKGREELMQTIPLKEIYCFNTSTGCHIHITPILTNGVEEYTNAIFKNKAYQFKGKKVKVRKVLDLKTIEEFRNELVKSVKHKLPKVYSEWHKQLFRVYAGRTEYISYTSRYSEFNLTMNDDGQIEYRSFNLCGVTTWEELFIMFEILSKTIKSVFGKKLKKNECFKDSIMIGINKEEIAIPQRKATIEL